jgi:hypothetical protein
VREEKVYFCIRVPRPLPPPPAPVECTRKVETLKWSQLATRDNGCRVAEFLVYFEKMFTADGSKLDYLD